MQAEHNYLVISTLLSISNRLFELQQPNLSVSKKLIKSQSRYSFSRIKCATDPTLQYSDKNISGLERNNTKNHVQIFFLRLVTVLCFIRLSGGHIKDTLNILHYNSPRLVERPMKE